MCRRWWPDRVRYCEVKEEMNRLSGKLYMLDAIC